MKNEKKERTSMISSVQMNGIVGLLPLRIGLEPARLGFPIKGGSRQSSSYLPNERIKK